MTLRSRTPRTVRTVNEFCSNSMTFSYIVCVVVWLAATATLLYASAVSELLPIFYNPAPNMPPKPLLNVLTADTAYLQSLLQHGSITSASLVDTYLAQIEKHDQYLKAVIQLTPLPLLRATAERLDFERKAGGLRGPLHGIPIIIKDNIASHPDLGLHTTAGSLALYNSKPPKNAKIVDLLIQAGAVILGKANLSAS